MIETETETETETAPLELDPLFREDLLHLYRETIVTDLAALLAETTELLLVQVLRIGDVELLHPLLDQKDPHQELPQVHLDAHHPIPTLTECTSHKHLAAIPDNALHPVKEKDLHHNPLPSENAKEREKDLPAPPLEKDHLLLVP